MESVILAPYTPSGAAQEAVESLPPEAHRVNVSGTETAYFDALAKAWAEGKGLIVVEHDVLLEPGALEELEACSEDWCCFPISSGTYLIERSLGCAKFSQDLVQAEPNLFSASAVEGEARVSHFHRDWRWVGAGVANALHGLGFEPHVHDRILRHLNENYEDPEFVKTGKTAKERAAEAPPTQAEINEALGAF